MGSSAAPGVWSFALVREALARVPDLAVVCFDATGRVIDVLNPGCLRRSEAELMGADVAKDLWGVAWGGGRESRPSSLEWSDTRTDAEFAIDLVPVVQSDGTRIGGIAMVRVATERKRSSELARAVFEEALDAIVIVDDDQRCVDVNDAACRLVGYTRQELLSRPIADLIATQAKGSWERFREGGSLVGHIGLRSAQGALVIAEFRSKANVAPGRHLSILRDATERLDKQQRLREAQALFEGAFDAAPVGMAMVDAGRDGRGTLQRVNAALAALVGAPEEELVGRHALDLVHPDDRDAVGAARAPAADQPIRTAPRLRRADGTHAWTEITTTVVRAADGRPQYMLAVVVDTTARHLAEERVRASEQRFRTMVESSSEGVWMLDAEDRLAFVNPRLAEMLGYGAEDLVGRPAAQLVVEEDAPTLALALEACRAGGRDRRELRLQCAGEGTLAVIVSLSPLSSGDGDYEGALAIVTDISELVAAERERELLRSRLHDRQRLEGIGRLAGGIAHEFNNLFGVILNYAGFLDAELADRPELHDDLRRIHAATERAVGLTRQLLTFSRQDLAAPQPVDLCEVLRHAEELLRPAVGDGVVIEVRAESVPCVVYADRRQIEQVLLNLAINAGEAMPDGGELAIELENSAPWAILRVRDTGMGMTVEAAARAFEPFFSVKSDARGIGLGLASVYGIVSESNGHVALDSREGAGTTVTVHLPAVEDAVPPLEASAMDRPDGVVLLVEDDPAVRELAARLLRRAGFVVIPCDDPNAALARPELADGSVEVLLTDLSLPSMTGEQLARQVRERLPAAAVVLMSGYTDDESAREAVRKSTVEFVQKPFTGDELVDGVRRALARAGSVEGSV